jgi:hypothetical protein
LDVALFPFPVDTKVSQCKKGSDDLQRMTQLMMMPGLETQATLQALVKINEDELGCKLWKQS